MPLFSDETVTQSISELRAKFLDALDQDAAALQSFDRAFHNFILQALESSSMLQDKTKVSIRAFAELVERISSDLLRTEVTSRNVLDDLTKDIMDELDPAMSSLSLECKSMSEDRGEYE